jgi:hypothetical protein
VAAWREGLSVGVRNRADAAKPPARGLRKGGSDVQITCPKCKQVHDVDEKTATCPDCRTVLRRCADCDKYDVRLSFCREFNRPVDTGEANYPTFSSESAYCRSYSPATAGS